jgi:transposase
MLKPKQLFIIIYVNVCMKHIYPHKTNDNILFHYGKIPESQFPSHDRVCDDRIRHLNHLRSLIVLLTKVNNLLFWTRTSMPQLRQNDCERAMGMVQTGMTHQVIADHFNVSRITISRLMIRLRQTGRTNDRPRNGRPRVTSRHDRHLCLIHLWNRMMTAEDTARRTHDLANIRILGQTVCRSLRESGLWARHPVVGPILKQRHRTWTYAAPSLEASHLATHLF